MKHPKHTPPSGLLVLILVSLAVACARSAFGLGIALPDHDAFATARGNAFTATADNPAAVFYNPAGISQLDGVNFSAGAYGLAYSDFFTSPGGAKFDSRTEWLATPDIFSTISLGKSHITLGLGAYSPYGLVEEWPGNAPFDPLGRYGSIQYLTVNPVVAYQPIPTLSMAIGPTLNYSEADLRESVGLPYDIHFRGRDEDVGFNAGILWHPLPEHSFGINYRSETEMDYKGHVTAPAPPPFFPMPVTLPTTAKFKFPRSVDFGYSFRPTTNWNFEADASWLDWETLNSLNLSGTTLSLPFNWQSSWMFKFGGTRYFGEGWRVSAGYMYVENSVRTAYFNPLIPDSDRHIFSVGIGKRYNKLSWDVAYQFAWGPSRDVSGDTLVVAPAPSPANGKYEFISHAITVNVGYHF